MSNHEQIGAPQVPASESSPDKVEMPPVEQAEIQEPPIEKQIENLNTLSVANDSEIAALEVTASHSKDLLLDARARLGLPPAEDAAPHDPTAESRMEELKSQQEQLEQHKKELLSAQEKERLIREEKERILQEKLDKLFEEFSSIASNALASLAKNGSMPNGGKYHSESLGDLNQKTAQSLVEAFERGMKMLPELLAAMPEIMEELDEQIAEEAEENVEQKLEEEKKILTEAEPDASLEKTDIIGNNEKSSEVSEPANGSSTGVQSPVNE